MHETFYISFILFLEDMYCVEIINSGYALKLSNVANWSRDKAVKARRSLKADYKLWQTNIVQLAMTKTANSDCVFTLYISTLQLWTGIAVSDVAPRLVVLNTVGCQPCHFCQHQLMKYASLRRTALQVMVLSLLVSLDNRELMFSPKLRCLTSKYVIMNGDLI